MLLLGRYYCWLLLLLINAATAKVLVFQHHQLLLSIAVANLDSISNIPAMLLVLQLFLPTIIKTRFICVVFDLSGLLAYTNNPDKKK